MDMIINKYIYLILYMNFKLILLVFIDLQMIILLIVFVKIPTIVWKMIIY